MSTVAELLILIDANIASILAGGKVLYYKIGDYTIDKRASLEVLLKLRESLMKEAYGAPVEEVTIYDDPDI